MEKIECLIFPHLKYSYTVCKSIATYYHNKYDIQMGVVRNIPIASPLYLTGTKLSAENLGVNIPSDEKLLLYQGAINVRRGIE